MADNTKFTFDTTKAQRVGQNVQSQRIGDMLFLAIDVSKARIDGAPVSKSGKSLNIATTNGNVTVGVGDAKLGLNFYTPKTA
jgi:hypothetical protein